MVVLALSYIPVSCGLVSTGWKWTRGEATKGSCRAGTLNSAHFFISLVSGADKDKTLCWGKDKI